MKKISALLLSLTTALTVSVCASAADLDVVITDNDAGSIVTTTHTAGAQFKTSVTDVGAEATLLAVYSAEDPEDGLVINTASIMALDQKSTEGGAAEFSYTLKGNELQEGYYVVKVGGTALEASQSNTITVTESKEEFYENEIPTITNENDVVGITGDLLDIEGAECGVVLTGEKLIYDIFFPVYDAKGGNKAIVSNGKFNIVFEGLYEQLVDGDYLIQSYYKTEDGELSLDPMTVTLIPGTDYNFSVSKTIE